MELRRVSLLVGRGWRPAVSDRFNRRLSTFADTLQWVIGVGAATAVVLLFTLDGAEESAVTVDQTAPVIETGGEIYAQHCQSCHGAEGQGGVGTRLSGVVVALYPDVADQVAVVRDGRNSMPPFGSVLTVDEIEAVVLFSRSDLG